MPLLITSEESIQANDLIPCRFETPALRPEGAHPLKRNQRCLSARLGQGCKPLPIRVHGARESLLLYTSFYLACIEWSFLIAHQNTQNTRLAQACQHTPEQKV